MATFELRDDWIKVATLVGPLVASSLAIFYDVGFFFGIGTGYFSFFSLAEHLVFALQALPIALLLALAFVAYVVLRRAAKRSFETNSERQFGKQLPTTFKEFDERVEKL